MRVAFCGLARCKTPVHVRQVPAMTWLRVLRNTFLLTLTSICVFGLGIHGQWESRLTVGHHSYILDLPSSPVWSPPEVPTYEAFKRKFGSADFPAPDTPGLSIRRTLRLVHMVVYSLTLLWPTAVIAGLLYLDARGKRRDFVLSAALWIGIGLSVWILVGFLTWLL